MDIFKHRQGYKRRIFKAKRWEGLQQPVLLSNSKGRGGLDSRDKRN